jgi:hypothetical protein
MSGARRRYVRDRLGQFASTGSSGGGGEPPGRGRRTPAEPSGVVDTIDVGEAMEAHYKFELKKHKNFKRPYNRELHQEHYFLDAEGQPRFAERDAYLRAPHRRANMQQMLHDDFNKARKKEVTLQDDYEPRWLRQQEPYTQFFLANMYNNYRNEEGESRNGAWYHAWAEYASLLRLADRWPNPSGGGSLDAGEQPLLEREAGA